MDDPVVRALVVEVLEELGYRTLEASDGPTGLEILQSKRRIDLLITDVGLPGMNGRQVADAARAGRPALKVRLMTGYTANAATIAGALGQNMAVMVKPFAMDALAKQVQEILRDGPAR